MGAGEPWLRLLRGRNQSGLVPGLLFRQCHFLSLRAKQAEQALRQGEVNRRALTRW